MKTIKLFMLFCLLATSALARPTRTFLFIHGGPGYNSNPEINLMKSEFEKRGMRIFFWNEPSTQRPNGPTFQASAAYINMVGSANKQLKDIFTEYGKVNLITHSFGTVTGRELARKNPEMIQSIIAISPATNIPLADMNIIDTAIADYEINDPSKATTLKKLKAKVTDPFDQNKINALVFANQNPRFATFYWTDQAIMMNYLQYLMQTGFEFDMNSYVSVRSTMKYQSKKDKIKVPALLIFGKDDTIVRYKTEMKTAKKVFRKRKVIKIAGVKHYPHIERMPMFFELVTNFIKTLK